MGKGRFRAPTAPTPLNRFGWHLTHITAHRRPPTMQSLIT